MKGHTHEDCDQLFSRYGTKLSKNNVVTVEDLTFLFKESFTPNPVPELLKVMYDVRDWVAIVNPGLHNISNPHVFVLKKNSAGSVVLRYKQWTRDEEWQPDKDPNKGIEILKHDVQIPNGCPKFVPSSPDSVDMDRLKKDIPKFLDNSRIISVEHKIWWADFFDHANVTYGEYHEVPTTWLLDELKIIKFGRSAVSQSWAEEGNASVDTLVGNGKEDNVGQFDKTVNDVTPLNVSQEVVQMVRAQKEHVPQVYTGPYRRATTVSSVSDIWEHVHTGSFVAVFLENYDKVPVIGKVMEKHETSFKIHYWKGSINKKWVPWLTHGKQPWTDTLPKDCIYLTAFELNNDSKLQVDTKRQIKAFLKART